MSDAGSAHDAVTVVIPMYNAADTIMRALESVVAQTAPPAKIVVVDDCSTDDSAAVVRAAKLPAVELVATDRNGGIAVARNRGAREASTEWLAFLDADDRWEPEFLDRTMAAIRQAQDATFGTCCPSAAQPTLGRQDETNRRYQMQTPLVEGTAPDLLALVHDNDYFRRVVATGDHEQVVVMTLDVGEDIGSEVHTDTDQVFIFVEGDGDAVLDAEIRSFNEGDLVFVRAGTQHNVINRGMTPLRLITIYAPPEHAAGTIHRTKAEAALEHQKRPESETAKQRLTELA